VIKHKISAIFISFIFFANISLASDDLEKQHIIDWHTHVAGLGYGDSGCFINEEMRDNFRFRFFMKWMDVSEEELSAAGDQIVVKKLSDKVTQSQYVDQAIVLALDGVINQETKSLDKVNTQFYVPNDYVARETDKYPNLLFGASINPNREDSLALLEKVYQQGAVLIKWIPSIMYIDPADKKLLPFYQRMAELNIPLLTHTGMEKSFPNTRDELADPRRLELALKAGVTVIAAHIATTGESEGQDNFERILPMFAEFPNLYADISSLTQVNKLGFLAKALKQDGLTERMIYGTDWPLQFFPVVSPWYHINHIGFKNAWDISKISNEWDRDIKLKEAYGVPYSVFSRKVGRLNMDTSLIVED
jgi:predicted TIM-barrel fold metal-dependent hydrolase